jgi:hypothetical protein
MPTYIYMQDSRSEAGSLMATIQIEANMSVEQLLHAVEKLPPEEFAAFLAQLLARARATRSGGIPTAAKNDTGTSEQAPEANPYLAAAGMFNDDSFAAEIDAFLTSQRDHEREEAADA